MTVIFSLILALVLLVGIIYALRTHNERTRENAIAREQPLPPLANNTAPAASAPPADDNSPPQAGATPAAEAPGESIISNNNLPDAVSCQTTDWRQSCQTLRDQGRFDEALLACQQAWPQWQSFDQDARVMRAAIRRHSGDAAQRNHWLQQLYRLAAQASFLHDKVAGLPDPSRHSLAKRFTPAQIDVLDMPWAELGYEQLRLLTKSDRKQLVQLWGEPDTHQSARYFHANQWLTSSS